MPKYIIERQIAGLGKWTHEELVAASRKSCTVLNTLGTRVQWLHSYVTNDVLYCVYIAPNVEMVREHARLGGFPAHVISEVKTIIDPITAEG